MRARRAAVACLLYIMTSAHVGLLRERVNTLAHVSDENRGWECRPEPFVERRRKRRSLKRADGMVVFFFFFLIESAFEAKLTFSEG